MTNKKIPSFFLVFLPLIILLFDLIGFADVADHFKDSSLDISDYLMMLSFLIAVASIVVIFIDEGWSSSKINVLKMLLLILDIAFVVGIIVLISWIIGGGSIFFFINLSFAILFVASIVGGLPYGIVSILKIKNEQDLKNKSILKKRGILAIMSPFIFFAVIVSNNIIDNHVQIRQVYADAGIVVVDGDKIVNALVKNNISKNEIISIKKVDGGYSVFTGIRRCDLACNNHSFFVQQINSEWKVEEKELFWEIENKN